MRTPFDYRFHADPRALSGTQYFEFLPGPYLDTADQAQPTERRVHPLALHFWGAIWTLAAHCELRRDFRTFRLDRISACHRTGDIFAEQPGRTLQDYLRHVGASPT